MSLLRWLIACKPEIIIADEPTTALDVTIQAQFLDLLEDIQKQSHSGIILITHDWALWQKTADEVCCYVCWSNRRKIQM